MLECIDGKSSRRVEYPARILESLIISAFILSDKFLELKVIDSIFCFCVWAQSYKGEET